VSHGSILGVGRPCIGRVLRLLSGRPRNVRLRFFACAHDAGALPRLTRVRCCCCFLRARRSQATKAGAALATRAQSLLAAGTRAKRATLAQCDECVQQAEALPLEVGAIDALRRVRAEAASWEGAAAGVLRRAAAAGTPPPLPELEALRAAAEQIALVLPSREPLESALGVARWDARRVTLCADGARPPELAALRAVVASGEKVRAGLPAVSAAALDGLSGCVAAGSA
jgi:hypothetical protein